LNRATAHINEHLEGDLSLAHLANVAGLSVSHFKMMFRRSVGMPVHQFVIRRRVQEAARLLSGGQGSISGVALQAGFANQSHMARCMRRVLGTTPAALLRAAKFETKTIQAP